ncbi:MAG TPA: c-type cytochrome [Kofleriaceae bacterium]
MKLPVITSLILPGIVAATAACGADQAEAPPPDSTMAAAVTYWQDVEPIFYTNCQSCHTAGGIGPFAIDDPDTAAAYASRIVTETAAKRMPPWPPGGDTPALLHTRSLTDDQLAKIKAWSDAGATMGDPSKPQPHQEPEVVDIGATAYRFDIGLSYTPDTSLSDDYRCFLAHVGNTDAQVATGFKVTPGNGSIVHHVIVGLFPASAEAELQALDAQTPDRAGWPCVGGLVPSDSDIDAKQSGQLGSWVPGVSAVAYPAGTGTALEPGQLAVIQMHYNLLGGDDPDRTKVEIAVAPAATAAGLIKLGGVGLIKHNLTIPAGASDAINEQAATLQQWRALRGGKPFPSGHAYLMGAGGHMHLVGKRIAITRTTAAGATDTLLDIPDWSFHWQGQYTFATPIELANTDTVTIRCEHDNSDQNRLAKGLPPGMAVTWGEGTTDEMCLAQLQIVDHLPD